MSDKNIPWPVWAFVMLGAALIGSPLIALHRGGDETETRGSSPLVPEPVKLVVTLKQEERGLTASATDAVGKPDVMKPVNGFHSIPIDGSILRQRYLTIADVVGLNSLQLDLLRNEIYARHGRRFQRPDLQQYFDAQPWYRPVYDPGSFDEGRLSTVERWNADFIANYQRQGL